MSKLTFKHKGINYAITGSHSDFYTPRSAVVGSDLAFLFINKRGCDIDVDEWMSFNSLTRYPYSHCKQNQIPVVPLETNQTVDDWVSDNLMRKNATSNPLKKMRLLERFVERFYGESLDRKVPERIAMAFANHTSLPGSYEQRQNEAWSHLIVKKSEELRSQLGYEPSVSIVVQTRGFALIKYIKQL
jgi:hypothetical protein